MKALSVRQPWAWAIVHAGKTIENRERWLGCKYRGPLLIHAAKGCTASEYADAVAWLTSRGLPLPPPLDELPRGGIVGVVEVTGIVRGVADVNEQQKSWWMGGFGLMLANAKPLPFREVRGMLGLFEVADG